MPGTTIQVLPIGLGIYGGITAIGIFAVAFVTWERVQYRKVCRELSGYCMYSFDRVAFPPTKDDREQLACQWIRLSDQRVRRLSPVRLVA